MAMASHFLKQHKEKHGKTKQHLPTLERSKVKSRQKQMKLLRAGNRRTAMTRLGKGMRYGYIREQKKERKNK